MLSSSLLNEGKQCIMLEVACQVREDLCDSRMLLSHTIDGDQNVVQAAQQRCLPQISQPLGRLVGQSSYCGC